MNMNRMRASESQQQLVPSALLIIAPRGSCPVPPVGAIRFSKILSDFCTLVDSVSILYKKKTKLSAPKTVWKQNGQFYIS